MHCRNGDARLRPEHRLDEKDIAPAGGLMLSNIEVPVFLFCYPLSSRPLFDRRGNP